jgi:hypothetical protein
MASNSGKRIAFTGGSGKAGRHVLPYLLSKGHKVLNIDLIDFPKANLSTDRSIYTLKTDLSESGQAMNALTSLFDMGEYALPKHLDLRTLSSTLRHMHATCSYPTTNASM